MKRTLKLSLWSFGGLALAAMTVAGAAYAWIGSRGDLLPQSQVAGVTLTEVPCAKELRGARCGKIKAPLDYTGADAGTVEVGFVYYPALWTEGQDAPVLNFIDGGPGQILSDDIKESPMALLRFQFHNRALLMIDARGVGGLSEALRCPVASQYDLEANEADKIATCAETIGRKRIHFSSANTARDFNLVRRVLGIKSVDLLAFSYGTAIAPLYAALYPDAVRTITLDGAFQVGPYEDLHLPTFHDAGMRRLRDICTRAKSCDYEKTKQNLTQVVVALRQNPRPLKPTGLGFAIPHNRRLDPETLALMMTADTQMRRDDDDAFKIIFPLIGALRQATRGDWTLLDHIAALTLQKNTLPASASAESGASLVANYALTSAIDCQEGDPLYDLKSNPQERAQSLSKAIARYPNQDRFAPFTVAEWTMGAFQSLQEKCIKYPAPPADRSPERRDIHVASIPKNIPTLIMVGDLDLLTPREDSLNASKPYAGAFFATFANFNHVISPNSPCALGLVSELITTKKIADVNACRDSDPVDVVVDHIPEKMRSPDAANGGGGFVR